jgi:transcriptional regulator of acetoin/glycerol metabolism
MDSHAEAGSGSPPLGSLLKAVIDATGEGVVVFDDGGRVVYASHAADAVIQAASASAAGAGAVLAQLLQQGGRRVPLRVGAHTLGEAVFLGTRANEASLAERERRAILETLRETGGRLTAAARHLGISRTTLWRRLKQYGARPDGGR